MDKVLTLYYAEKLQGEIRETLSVREYYLKNKEVMQVDRRNFSPQNVETPFAALIPFQHFATPYRAWLYISQLLLGITLLYEESFI